MLRGLSNVRRRVEQLATLAGSGRCSGYHRIHRGPVYVSNDNPSPPPPWPNEDTGEWCACGAKMEFFTIVHQLIPDDGPVIPDDHPESSTVH